MVISMCGRNLAKRFESIGLRIVPREIQGLFLGMFTLGELSELDFPFDHRTLTLPEFELRGLSRSSIPGQGIVQQSCVL